MTKNYTAFSPNFIFTSGHLNTIITNKLRKVNGVNYTRQRIDTWDNDFIDLDFSKIGSKSLVIILHGLEGNSNRHYARGMVSCSNNNQLDAVVLNLRSCSGEMNLLPTSYHSGKTDDLRFVLNQIEKQYEKIYIIGLSLGGNILLKYLGEESAQISKKIIKTIAFSVPIDLTESAKELSKAKNWIYMQRFLKSLKRKMTHKINQFSELNISAEELNKCKNFIDFDNLYTAPIHGFKNAEDYWKKSSALQFLDKIAVPTLLVNALNDPFLGPNCFPFKQTKNHKFLDFIAPKYGGHVGFSEKWGGNKPLWSERLAMEYFSR